MAKSFKVTNKEEGLVILSAWQKDPFVHEHTEALVTDGVLG